MPLIEVQSGDSGGISVTGKPPARAGFSRPGGEKDCPLSFRTYPHAPRNGNQHGLFVVLKKENTELYKKSDPSLKISSTKT